MPCCLEALELWLASWLWSKFCTWENHLKTLPTSIILVSPGLIYILGYLNNDLMLRLGSFCEDTGCYWVTSNQIWKLVLTGTWFAGAVIHKAVWLRFYRDSKSLREACSFGLLLETHWEKWLHCSVCRGLPNPRNCGYCCNARCVSLIAINLGVAVGLLSLIIVLCACCLDTCDYRPRQWWKNRFRVSWNFPWVSGKNEESVLC